MKTKNQEINLVIEYYFFESNGTNINNWFRIKLKYRLGVIIFNCSLSYLYIHIIYLYLIVKKLKVTNNKVCFYIII